MGDTFGPTDVGHVGLRGSDGHRRSNELPVC